MRVSRKCLGHVINVTFWDLLPALLIDSMRPRKWVWNFWGFSGLSSPRWDQKMILPPEPYKSCVFVCLCMCVCITWRQMGLLIQKCCLFVFRRGENFKSDASATAADIYTGARHTCSRKRREPGIFLWKKNCRRQPATLFWESLASRRRCLREFWTNF